MQRKPKSSLNVITVKITFYELPCGYIIDVCVTIFLLLFSGMLLTYLLTYLLTSYRSTYVIIR